MQETTHIYEVKAECGFSKGTLFTYSDGIEYIDKKGKKRIRILFSEMIAVGLKYGNSIEIRYANKKLEYFLIDDKETAKKWQEILLIGKRQENITLSDIELVFSKTTENNQKETEQSGDNSIGEELEKISKKTEKPIESTTTKETEFINEKSPQTIESSISDKFERNKQESEIKYKNSSLKIDFNRNIGTMNFCIKCGSPLQENASFCSSCGFKCEKGNLDDKSYDELYESAINILNKNDLERAYIYFEKITEKFPDDIKGYFYYIYCGTLGCPIEYLEEQIDVFCKSMDIICERITLTLPKEEQTVMFTELYEPIAEVYKELFLRLYDNHDCFDSVDGELLMVTLLESQKAFSEYLDSATLKDYAEKTLETVASDVSVYKTVCCKEHKIKHVFEKVIIDIENIIIEKYNSEYARRVPVEFGIDYEAEEKAKKENAKVELNNSDNKTGITTPLHCRLCDAEIESGTLCTNCLNSSNDEDMTREERKRRNDTKASVELLIRFIGVIIGLIGVIVFFTTDAEIEISTLLVIIGIIVFIYGGRKNKGSVCPNCQRRNTMELVDKKVVNSKEKYVTEKRTVYQTKSNGYSQTIGNRNEWKMDVDVPATSVTYKLSYKCKICGHVVDKYETKTIKQ